MAKLNRSQLLHYVNATPSAVSAEWYLIGKDVESMNMDLGADVETSKNILDETSVKFNGYEPTMDVDTYYANPDDSIYDFIVDIVMNRKKGDDAKTSFLEVLIADTSDAKHDGWVEDCYIIPTSYGGEQGGVAIPFTVRPSGNRKKVSVALNGKVPTIEE